MIPNKFMSVIFVSTIILLMTLCVVLSFRLSSERLAHAESRIQYTQYVAQVESTARKVAQEARVEEQRRAAVIQEVSNVARTEIERAQADVAAATSVSERLRQRIAALTAKCNRGTEDSPPTGGGEAADTTADLRAIVLGRLDQAAGDLAEYADRARSAGAACERIADAIAN